MEWEREVTQAGIHGARGNLAFVLSCASTSCTEGNTLFNTVYL